ncbi:MAG: efflux transporter, family, subunit [Betaproteobacteria bacterium]|nr:efflux transporter, family, subunit [Betaproteobacteria bacterium]
MNTRTAAVVLVLAAAAGAAGYFAGDRKGVAQGEAKSAAAAPPASAKPGEIKYAEGAPQLSALKMEAAVDAPLPLAEPLNGKVSYDEDVTARITSPIAGRIVALKAAAGDPVKAGQVLVNIDAPDFAAAIADTSKAQADEARKRLAMERSQKLFDGEVIPRKDLESAAADYAQAQAETQRARARLKNLSPAAAGDGPGLALRSPIAGIVADRKANPSQEVQPGSDPLFIVSNLSKLWVLVDLPERHLATVKAGLPVSVSVEAFPGESFRGVVSRVGQVVNADTRRVQVRCDLANPEGKLRPEMYARVTLLTEEGKQAVRLPNTALVTEGLYSYVFIETAPRQFTKRRVKLAVQDREFSYASEGVAKGERVVIGGALLLQSELASTN